MLKGNLVYKDRERGDITFDLFGLDSFTDLKLYIPIVQEDYRGFIEDEKLMQTGEYQTIIRETAENSQELRKFELLDARDAGAKKWVDLATYRGGTGWNTRRLDIKKTNKYKSNIQNTELCVQIAALIRYVQIAGKQNYNQGLQNVTFSAEREVIVRHPKTGNYIGKVNYNMGLITGLSCENKYMKIELVEVGDVNFETAIFAELKEKDKWNRQLSATPVVVVGLKMTEEVLGFAYVPEVDKEHAQLFGMYDTIEEVIENNPDKNTNWILEQNYQIVTDENLDEVIKLFMDHQGVIAFDTETSGLKINFKSRTNEADQLVGCVLTRKVGEGFYFPLQHKLFANLCDGDHHYFMERYMRPLLERKRIICHNLKFDWKVAYIYDININCVYDTMLAMGVTKGYAEPNYPIGLKALVKNIFGLDMFELSDFIIGGSFGSSEVAFWDLPYELVRQYAPADTDKTMQLYEFIESEDILNKYNAKKTLDMEITFAKAAGYSEFYGYHIDVDRVPELRARIEGEMDMAKADMFAIAGREFNPNSPLQLCAIMYDELGVEQLGEKRKTDKDVLKALKQRENADGTPKYPFVVALKRYRDNEGIYKNFLKRLHEFSTPDGYIFPDTMQIGTTTGRVAVKNPNYQSYNDIVKHYVTPRKGFMSVDSDFAQIEYRVLCSMAGQYQLIEAFNDPDLDYHTYQAARMFGVPYAAVSKALRQQSKGVNFGLPYGMGDRSLGKAIFGEQSPENTIKAGILRKKFFQGQEKIEKFFEETRRDGVKNGYTSTHFGRRRYYQKGLFDEAAIRRQAGNHVIQGTAADIYKMAVVQMFNRVVAEGWLGKVLFNTFVHDEILMEVHESIDAYEFTKAWREEFEVRIEGYTRLFAGLGYGACWYDAKKLDLPPQYISDIIAKTEEEGREWHGDHKRFLKEIKDGFEIYKTKRIETFVCAEENQGEVIKPVIGSLLYEEIGKIGADIQRQGLQGEYNGLLVGEKISELSEGDKKAKAVELKDLQNQLKVYCKYYGIDYTKVDMISPDAVQQSTQGNMAEDDGEDDEMPVGLTEAELQYASAQINGYGVDHAAMEIYLVELGIRTTKGIVGGTKMLMDKHVFTKEGGYKVKYYTSRTKSIEDGELIPDVRVSREGLDALMRYYAAWLNTGMGVML